MANILGENYVVVNTFNLDVDASVANAGDTSGTLAGAFKTGG